MPFIRRKRGQVLLVHSRRNDEGKVQQHVLHAFETPDEIAETLEDEAWEAWTRAMEWRFPHYRWDWDKLKKKLSNELVLWMATPSGQALRREQHIETLCQEIRQSLGNLNRARPADRKIVETVQPTLVRLREDIGSLLSPRQERLMPLAKTKETLMESQQQHEEAERLFDEGMEYWWAGDRRTACRFYRKALKIDPLYADAHNHLGIDLVERSRLKDAEKHYRQAIEGGSRHLERDRGLVEWGWLENRPYLRALGNVALLHDRRGEHEEAVRLWEQILTLNPNDNQGIRYLLGGGYHRLGRLDDAIAAYERAQEDAGCCHSLALALHEDGQDDRVGAALLRGISRNQYIAPMLLGERWEKVEGWHGTNMAEPEWAADYVEGFGDVWRLVPDGAELLRKWWQAEPVQDWLNRTRVLTKELGMLSPDDERRSLLFHRLDSMRSEATLRMLAAEVEPEHFRDDMPRKKRFVATLDQVQISRDGEETIIEYFDPEVAGTRLQIGPELAGLDDQEVLDMHNEVLLAVRQRREADPYVAVEIPPGQPQIEFDHDMGHWSMRGAVLRCLIDEMEGELRFSVDERLLSLQDLTDMLRTYNGWGMQLVIVPDDEVEQEATVLVQEPPSGV